MTIAKGKPKSEALETRAFHNRLREELSRNVLTPGDVEPRIYPENRQGLCAECHAAKTAKDMGYQYRPKVVIGKDGWPVE